MVGRIIFFALAALFALTTPVWAQENRGAGQRLALILAVADYDGDGAIASSESARSALTRGRLHDLKTPLNDADLVHQALSRQGFTSQVYKNLKRDETLAAVRRFSALVANAPPDSTVIIYWAGHGAKLKQGSFIFPANAEITHDATTVGPASGAIGDDELVRLLGPERRNVWRYFILDSCRDNPWEQPTAGDLAERNRLVQMRTITGGSYVPGLTPRGGALDYAWVAPIVSRLDTFIWSTREFAPASDGARRYSPFAQAFARRIGDRGKTLFEIYAKISDDVRAETNGQQSPFYYTLEPRSDGMRRCLGVCR